MSPSTGSSAAQSCSKHEDEPKSCAREACVRRGARPPATKRVLAEYRLQTNKAVLSGIPQRSIAMKRN